MSINKFEIYKYSFVDSKSLYFKLFVNTGKKQVILSPRRKQNIYSKNKGLIYRK